MILKVYVDVRLQVHPPSADKLQRPVPQWTGRSCFLYQIRYDSAYKYLRPNSVCIKPTIARLAQLVERFIYTEDVGSSSLSARTTRLEAPFGVFFSWKHKANLGVPVLISS